MKKKIVSFILIVTLMVSALNLFGIMTAEAEEEEPVETTVRYNYGLHVEADGSITLEGQQFWGFGLNYFGAFCHYEGGSLSYESMKDAFPVIAAHNIPFVRLPLGGYYPDYYDRFDADREAVFSKMQQVLDAAAENHVGVIVSLLWWDAALPEYAGERRSAMGDVNSETMRLAKEYVTAVVTRFVNHPAVWGWEIGNEYNLDADLCDYNAKDFLWGDGLPGFVNKEHNGYDYFTSNELVTFYEEIAGTIRSIDGYRMITTGNSEMRGSAWHMHQASRRPNAKHMWSIDWTADNKTNFEKAVELYSPNPTDTISFHLQFGTAGSSNPNYILSVDRVGQKNLAVKDYFKAYAEVGQKLGKAVYFGEFGDFIDMENAEDMPAQFKQIGEWITEAGIQIASLWQYQDFSDTGAGALKYDVLSELNQNLRENGLQDSVTPWGEHEAVTETVTKADTEPDTENETEQGTSAVTETVPADTYVTTNEKETYSAETGCASQIEWIGVITVVMTMVAVGTAIRILKNNQRRRKIR